MSRRRRGFLLTVEGVDGSGKSTQVRRIASFLKRRGHHVTVVREPGGTRLAERIRRLLLDFRSAGLAQPAELFLYLAARGQLFAEVIEPALDSGHVVVCDRFTDSTLAYQGGGRGFPENLLRRLNDVTTSSHRPDLTLLLDLPLVLSNRRKGRIADRLESEKGRFYRRVQQRYRAVARKESRRVAVIDASRDKAAVWKQIRDILERRLPGRINAKTSA
jgi:dTMP kinase